MKKILLSLVFVTLCVSSFAQGKDTVAIYSKLYSDREHVSLTPLVTEITASLLEKYILVERMEEFQHLVDKELKYQESGRVADDQLARLGEEFGADQVCAVLVEYNNISGAYFYSVELLSVEKKDIKSAASASTSDLSIKSQLGAAKTIIEKLFPPKKEQPVIKYTRDDLLSNDGVEVLSNGRFTYDEDVVKELLAQCHDSRAMDLYLSGLKSKKASRIFNIVGILALVPGVACQFGWLHEVDIYEEKIYSEEKTTKATIVIQKPTQPQTVKEKVGSTRWHDTTKTAVAFSAVGVGFLTVGGILSSASENKVRKALGIYNKELRSSKYYSPSWAINVAPSGVGLCLTF